MKFILIALSSFVLVFVASFLMAYPLMWAWNYVIPFVFGLPKINVIHSFCLMIVSSILLKSTISNKSE
jgi:hypothetical protein